MFYQAPKFSDVDTKLLKYVPHSLALWSLKHQELELKLEELTSVRKPQDEVQRHSIVADVWKGCSQLDRGVQTDDSEIIQLNTFKLLIASLQEQIEQVRKHAVNAVDTQEMNFKKDIERIGKEVYASLQSQVTLLKESSEERLQTVRKACRQQLADEICRLSGFYKHAADQQVARKLKEFEEEAGIARLKEELEEMTSQLSLSRGEVSSLQGKLSGLRIKYTKLRHQLALQDSTKFQLQENVRRLSDQLQQARGQRESVEGERRKKEDDMKMLLKKLQEETERRTTLEEELGLARDTERALREALRRGSVDTELAQEYIPPSKSHDGCKRTPEKSASDGESSPSRPKTPPKALRRQKRSPRSSRKKVLPVTSHDEPTEAETKSVVDGGPLPLPPSKISAFVNLTKTLARKSSPSQEKLLTTTIFSGSSSCSTPIGTCRCAGVGSIDVQPEGTQKDVLLGSPSSCYCQYPEKKHIPFTSSKHVTDLAPKSAEDPKKIPIPLTTTSHKTDSAERSTKDPKKNLIPSTSSKYVMYSAQRVKEDQEKNPIPLSSKSNSTDSAQKTKEKSKENPIPLSSDKTDPAQKTEEDPEKYPIPFNSSKYVADSAQKSEEDPEKNLIPLTSTSDRTDSAQRSKEDPEKNLIPFTSSKFVAGYAQRSGNSKKNPIPLTSTSDKIDSAHILTKYPEKNSIPFTSLKYVTGSAQRSKEDSEKYPISLSSSSDKTDSAQRLTKDPEKNYVPLSSTSDKIDSTQKTKEGSEKNPIPLTKSKYVTDSAQRSEDDQEDNSILLSSSTETIQGSTDQEDNVCPCTKIAEVRYAAFSQRIIKSILKDINHRKHKKMASQRTYASLETSKSADANTASFSSKENGSSQSVRTENDNTYTTSETDLGNRSTTVGRGQKEEVNNYSAMSEKTTKGRENDSQSKGANMKRSVTKCNSSATNSPKTNSLSQVSVLKGGNRAGSLSKTGRVPTIAKSASLKLQYKKKAKEIKPWVSISNVPQTARMHYVNVTPIAPPFDTNLGHDQVSSAQHRNVDNEETKVKVTTPIGTNSIVSKSGNKRVETSLAPRGCQSKSEVSDGSSQQLKNSKETEIEFTENKAGVDDVTGDAPGTKESEEFRSPILKVISSAVDANKLETPYPPARSVQQLQRSSSTFGANTRKGIIKELFTKKRQIQSMRQAMLHLKDLPV